ncbi:hypothetical protein [Nonomuraea sp. NPDC050540]|uniref:hypothetical protein n=1 Tax=Nonomuraea sp. NPDC050540 TaxID=3364367 RepID=UPI0037882673
MSERDIYTITATRSDGWWALTVSGPGLKRAYPTQVKRLEQAEEMARDLVATMLDTEPDKIDADFCVRVADEEIARALEATLRARLTAELIRQQAAEATRTTVATLANRGYVHRDIGFLLGMSHQAIGKLLDESAVPPLPTSLPGTLPLSPEVVAALEVLAKHAKVPEKGKLRPSRRAGGTPPPEARPTRRREGTRHPV